MEGLSEERCALVGELVQVLEMVRQLDAHMVGQLGGGGGGSATVGDERCRALVATMRASIDRSVHMARSTCAEGRLLVGQPESPPSGGDGSQRSGGSDQAGDSRGRGNAAGGQCKKRKTLPKLSMQVRVSAVQDVAPLDDGQSWRKYGQKDILGAKYPRSYFRCTHRHTQGCHASKHVQRTDGDPLLFNVVYHGSHTCAQAPAAAHHSNQTNWPAATADHPDSQAQPQTGQERSSTEFGAGPFPLPSDKPAAGANNAGSATSSGTFSAGCVTASTFMPPAQATPECQLIRSGGSSSYVVGGGSGMSLTGFQNMADVELASGTNSPIGEMDLIFPLDTADFFENSSYF